MCQRHIVIFHKKISDQRGNRNDFQEALPPNNPVIRGFFVIRTALTILADYGIHWEGQNPHMSRKTGHGVGFLLNLFCGKKNQSDKGRSRIFSPGSPQINRHVVNQDCSVYDTERKNRKGFII